MKTAERLKEKSIDAKVLVDVYANGYKNYATKTVILLDNALEILKDSYSKDKVEELLRSQRVICKEALVQFLADEGKVWTNEINIILNAPQPTLK